MAEDQFQLGSGNWWGDSLRNRPENGSTPSSTPINSLGNFDPNLEYMGLGLSSPGGVVDWTQHNLLRGDQKAKSSLSSMFQEDYNRPNDEFQQQAAVMASANQDDQWGQKIYPGSSDDSSLTEFKQRNQPQFSSSTNTPGNNSTVYGFNMDSAHVYGGNSNFENRGMNYSYSYDMNSGEVLPTWSKYPQVSSSSPASINDVQSSFFPLLQAQLSKPSFNEKPKNKPENRCTNTVKKNSGEASNKRARNEAPSPSPALKVRKEKMGDRITTLQQLVSPFGKTDTASVLSEAIEYIKFLHEQVSVLSNPYIKNGAPMQHQQRFGESMNPEGQKQALRSRGLCLVPVSSTFPVTQETPVDFWTPTFGATFR